MEGVIGELVSALILANREKYRELWSLMRLTNGKVSQRLGLRACGLKSEQGLSRELTGEITGKICQGTDLGHVLGLCQAFLDSLILPKGPVSRVSA